MPFSSHLSYLGPEHLDLLTRVLNRIIDRSSAPIDDLDKHDIASRLIVAFKSGRRDEEGLISLFGSDAAA